MGHFEVSLCAFGGWGHGIHDIPESILNIAKRLRISPSNISCNIWLRFQPIQRWSSGRHWLSWLSWAGITLKGITSVNHRPSLTVNKQHDYIYNYPALADMYGPWASPSLAVACGALAWNSDTVSVLCRERLWEVVTLKRRYRNSLNEWMNYHWNSHS